jgi:YD repeat-containing protein
MHILKISVWNFPLSHVLGSDVPQTQFRIHRRGAMNPIQPSSKAFRPWYLLLVLLIAPGFAKAQTVKKPSAPPARSAPVKPTATSTPKQPPQQQKKEPPKKEPPPQKNPPQQKPPEKPPQKPEAKPDGGEGGSNRINPRASNKVFRPDGTSSVTKGNGTRVDYDKKGNRTAITTRSGATGKLDQRGRLSSVKFKSSKGYNTTVNHGAHGARTISSEHVDARGEHVRIVNNGPHNGHVDHTFTRNGRTYMRETRVINGHVSTYVYARYNYRGGFYYNYVPAYYYGAGFYSWAYNPWAPVSWAWGWGAAPWYGYYGYYFAPYPIYASPAFWLTDYLIAANLQAAYDASAGSNPDPDPAPDNTNTGTLSPETKQAIADAVKAQLEADRDAASSQQGQGGASDSSSSSDAAAPQQGDGPVPAALDPKQTIFIVSASLSESTADGTDCSLTQGDVLSRLDDTPDAKQNVLVRVTSSQQADCSAGSKLMVAVQDLQDMHNDFQAKVNDGLQKLADSQGKNGIPKSPDPARRDNPSGTAQPDLTAQADLEQQQQDANKTEKEVLAEAKDSTNNN